MQFITPLRYPGGKGRLTQVVADIMESNDLIGGHYAEPYAGGASVALSLLMRSEEHTSELQSLMRISYAVFCLKKKNRKFTNNNTSNSNNKITKIRKHLAKPNTKSTT